MTRAEKVAMRKKFIDDWTATVFAQCGGNPEDEIAKAYAAFTVSQILDAAIYNAKKLDLGFNEGYVL